MPSNDQIDNVLNGILLNRHKIALQQFAKVSIYLKKRDRFSSKITHMIIIANQLRSHLTNTISRNQMNLHHFDYPNL